jgi:hypothetical protein
MLKHSKDFQHFCQRKKNSGLFDEKSLKLDARSLQKKKVQNGSTRMYLQRALN